MEGGGEKRPPLVHRFLGVKIDSVRSGKGCLGVAAEKQQDYFLDFLVYANGRLSNGRMLPLKHSLPDPLECLWRLAEPPNPSRKESQNL